MVAVEVRSGKAVVATVATAITASDGCEPVHASKVSSEVWQVVVLA